MYQFFCKFHELIITNICLNVNKTDKELYWFLRGGNYDIEDTKKLIQTNRTHKQMRPKVFKNRDPTDPDIRAVWNIM